MKVSVITSVFNGRHSIEACIKSVLSQSWRDIEYIIIDAGSTDGTLDIIQKYAHKLAKVVSEPDSGIYDALNKGIGLALGDIIGILHSDDFYANNAVIEKVAGIIEKENVESCYGDLEYVSRKNPERIIRYWKAGHFSARKFENGWMPPHPAFFIKKAVYERYGYFNTDFKIAADYELMLRFLVKEGISTRYLPEVLVKMRVGGASNRSFKNLLIKSYEDLRAWKVNGLGNFKAKAILLKNLIKIPQFFRRR